MGQGVSALGDWMGTIAFMVVVHHITDSSAAVGGVLVIRLLPAALAGPLAARAVHRWDRRQTMLAMDLVRAALIALVPLFASLWWVYLLAFLVEVASLVFLPARDASVPDLAGDGDLALANGLVLGSSYGTIPLGAAAFAAVAAIPLLDDGGIAGRPYALVFWVDAATYLVSFVLVSRITGLARVATGPVEEEVAPSFRKTFRIPLVRAVMPATATVAMGLGTLFSVGVVFVRDVLDATDAQFGFLIALFGVGAVVGVVIVRAFENSLQTVRVAVLVQGAWIAVMSLAPGITPAFLGAAGFGAATAATLASGMSILQARFGGDERVLAFAVFHVVIRAGLSVAAIAAGVAADVVGNVRLVLFAAGLVVMASALLVSERPSSREPRHPT
jgi:predicted MFS family arabinose efflux permease